MTSWQEAAGQIAFGCPQCGKAIEPHPCVVDANWRPVKAAAGDDYLLPEEVEEMLRRGS